MSAEQMTPSGTGDTPIYDDLVRTVLGASAAEPVTDDLNKAPDSSRRPVLA